MIAVVGRILKWIGALTVAFILLIVVLAVSIHESLPEKMVLQVDFRDGTTEYIGDHPLALIQKGNRLDIRRQVETILKAAADDRVVGLIGRVGGARMSLAHVQEISDAIRVFRESDKPSVAFAESIGGLAAANASYLLATAFENIKLQPSGSVGLVGLSVEHPFFRGSLDSLGVIPSFGKREAYKTGPNLFTEAGFTEAHREAAEALLSGHFEQLVAGVANGRDVDQLKVRSWIDAAPLSAQAALSEGAVDQLAYLDEVRSAFAGASEPTIVDLADYAQHSSAEGVEVALVHAVGTIVPGKSTYDPVGESNTVGSDTIVEAIRDALDSGAPAIVLRVDSPGGAYSAADAIWRATRLAQESSVPVIVSMSSVAASGGYLISTHADHVIAQPGTITGSIGVWGGKFVMRDMWRKIGVTFDSVHFGPQARFSSTLTDFSESERMRFEAQLDRVYDAFVAQVSDGRNLLRQKVSALAQGKVWTGQQAQEVGLVDEIGGYAAAIEVARDLLGLAPDTDIQFVIYPKPKDLAERIIEGDWESLKTKNDLSLGRTAIAIAGRITSVVALAVWAPWVEGFLY